MNSARGSRWRTLVTAALLVTGGIAAGPTEPVEPVETPKPAWLTADGWLYNPRDRLRAATEALEREQPDLAIEAAETARRLAGDAQSLFNEGTVLQRERSLPTAERNPLDPQQTVLTRSTNPNYVDEVLSPRIFRFGIRLNWE